MTLGEPRDDAGVGGRPTGLEALCGGGTAGGTGRDGTAVRVMDSGLVTPHCCKLLKGADP
jgi:hypothetical protein